MISTSLIPNTVYNSLPHITKQTVLSEDDLHAIGPLFIEHSMHSSFGVALLHKHFELEPDEVMVHKGLTCEPHLSPYDSLTAKAFYLHNGKFQAYEHELDCEPGILPDEPFLTALAQYLVDHNLGKTLALTRVGPDPWAPVLLERGEGRSHVCSPAEKRVVDGHEVDYCGDHDFVDTEWRFRPCCCGGVKAKVVKKCEQVKEPPGGHMDV